MPRRDSAAACSALAAPELSDHTVSTAKSHGYGLREARDARAEVPTQTGPKSASRGLQTGATGPGGATRSRLPRRAEGEAGRVLSVGPASADMGGGPPARGPRARCPGPRALHHGQSELGGPVDPVKFSAVLPQNLWSADKTDNARRG